MAHTKLKDGEMHAQYAKWYVSQAVKGGRANRKYNGEYSKVGIYWTIDPFAPKARVLYCFYKASETVAENHRCLPCTVASLVNQPSPSLRAK